MSPTPIAVLVSGGGRSLENLAQVIGRGELDARLTLALSDRPGVGALERAARLEIPSAVVPRAEYPDVSSFSEEVFGRIQASGAELVVLAGFLRLISLPPNWHGRVLNIHPSLLPAFGGKGYYGERVHRAVLERGVQYSGCTVHYVDEQYDQGPILHQRCVEVLPDDSVDSLAARVFEAEKLALPEAIRQHIKRAATTRS